MSIANKIPRRLVSLETSFILQVKLHNNKIHQQPSIRFCTSSIPSIDPSISTTSIIKKSKSNSSLPTTKLSSSSIIQGSLSSSLSSSDCIDIKSIMKTPKSSCEDDDIEELHRRAVVENDCATTYIDPATGFMVFTEIAHFKRGVCCGNQCRHCPYGWVNVPSNPNNAPSLIKRKAKVKSGDPVQVKALLESYQQQALEFKMKTNLKSLIGNKESYFPSSQAVDEQKNIDAISSFDESPATTAINKTKSTKHGEVEKIKSKTGGRHGGKLTDKNVPYTRTGDSGTSQLLNGERRPKNDIRFEAMGEVDELCSVTGVVYAEIQRIHREQVRNTNNVDTATTTTEKEAENLVHEFEEWLLEIMSRLFDIGSHVAKPRRQRHDDDSDTDSETFTPNGVGGGFDADHIDVLEGWIDTMTDVLPELTSFILPTGSCVAAQLHVARTVCRRAERRVVSCGPNAVDPNAIKYLNRLSDFYFTGARYLNFIEHDDEILYRRPTRDSKQRSRVTVSYKKDES